MLKIAVNNINKKSKKEELRKALSERLAVKWGIMKPAFESRLEVPCDAPFNDINSYHQKSKL